MALDLWLIVASRWGHKGACGNGKLDTQTFKQLLLFAVTQDIDDTIRVDVRSFVTHLTASFSWMLGPPVYVDNIEWPEDASRGDHPIETLGGYLEIYSAHPPWSLPREVDVQLLEQVTTLLNALAVFSSKRSLDFEVELGGEIIGYVESGQMDEGLADVFLGEWRRGLMSGKTMVRADNFEHQRSVC